MRRRNPERRPAGCMLAPHAGRDARVSGRDNVAPDSIGMRTGRLNANHVVRHSRLAAGPLRGELGTCPIPWPVEGKLAALVGA